MNRSFGIGHNNVKMLALLAAASIPAMIHSGWAFAQAPAPQAAIPADQAAAPGLEEIVVTARRRSEDIQKTPIAVTAFTAAAIEARGMQTAADVTNFTPNVQFDSSASEAGGGGSSQIAIRGIGETDYVITVEPAVGLYLDGVYIGKSMGSLVDLVDTDSIQVLRGAAGHLVRPQHHRRRGGHDIEAADRHARIQPGGHDRFL